MIFHTQVLDPHEVPDFGAAVLFDGFPTDPAMIASTVAETVVEQDPDSDEDFSHSDTIDLRVAVWGDEVLMGVWVARVTRYFSYYAQSTPETPWVMVE